MEPITCVSLGDGPCSGCKEVAAIRPQIKQLEEELVKLKAKRDTLATTINTIHDPFIHKLPPEIGSHIFRLSLPTFDYKDHRRTNAVWIEQREWAAPLRLGAVCHRWRQLAWATPDLWTTVYLAIGPSTKRSLMQSLPGLLREWLRRSRSLPLSILFHHSSVSDATVDSGSIASEDDIFDEPTVLTLEVATVSVIGILTLYSGRWRSLYINADADIFTRFFGSIKPKELVGLALTLNYSGVLPAFIPELVFNPIYLQLTNFPLNSIEILCDNITHATIHDISIEEGLDFLRRAPNLEYYRVFMHFMYNPQTPPTPILHPRLRSLHLSTCDLTNVLKAITLPSLEEWTQDMLRRHLPVTVTLSFLQRSGCCLKALTLKTFSCAIGDPNTLFQALPSLEHLQVSHMGRFNDTIVIDDIIARIFHSAPGGSDISVHITAEPFLPKLQSLGVFTVSSVAAFPWDCIPELYHQGHRQSLTLWSSARKSHMTDETALQLLQLVDEGMDLQIDDEEMGGDFLENFRKSLSQQSL